MGRIHHAFLFTGARGVGKTTAARALARSLNCERGPTADPCGACTSCREVSNGSSPDLIEIDGASNNSVDDVRELNRKLGFQFPLDGPKTLNGLVLEHLRDIPEPNTSLKIAGHYLEIVQTQDRVVKAVRVLAPVAEKSGATGA